MNKPTFNAGKIIEAIKAVIPAATATTGEAGGSWDTVQIIVSIPSSRDKILISGHNRYETQYENGLEPRDNVPVEFIELSDTSADSRGGIQSTNENVIRAGAEIKIVLKNLGFNRVGGHYDEYY